MNPYISNSEDIVNQITLNCLISKSQLMKINNSKIKKNLEIERNKNIKENHTELLQLFENLVNEKYPENLFDDVKNSYIHFIDKSLIYLNSIKKENMIDENKKYESEKIIINKTDYETTNHETNYKTEKLNNMIEECYNVNSNIINNNYDNDYDEYEKKYDNNNKIINSDNEYGEDDDENDEDDEY